MLTENMPIELVWIENHTTHSLSISFEMVGGCEPSWAVIDSRNAIGDGYGDEQDAIAAFTDAVRSVMARAGQDVPWRG